MKRALQTIVAYWAKTSFIVAGNLMKITISAYELYADWRYGKPQK